MKSILLAVVLISGQSFAQTLPVQPVQDYGHSRTAVTQPIQSGQSPQQSVAIWTGQSRSVTTVTGLQGFACGYQYAGQFFERVFTGFCPTTIEIQ